MKLKLPLNWTPSKIPVTINNATKIEMAINRQVALSLSRFQARSTKNRSTPPNRRIAPKTRKMFQGKKLKRAHVVVKYRDA